MPDDEVETDARAAERLTYFSDAVVAIAITLLAIDLPVPAGVTVSAFWLSVEHDDGHYAAFLISFVVIAAAWSDHHELFAYVQRVDGRLRTLNIWWLLSIVLNPFATKLLVVSGQNLATHALRFGFYALLQVLGSAMLYAMLRHMKARRLADIPAPVSTSLTRKSYLVMVGFGLSIPVFFVTAYAWVFWIVGPILGGQLRRQRRSRSKAVELCSISDGCGQRPVADTGSRRGRARRARSGPGRGAAAHASGGQRGRRGRGWPRQDLPGPEDHRFRPARSGEDPPHGRGAGPAQRPVRRRRSAAR
jgi:uncharacterized membrane protein